MQQNSKVSQRKSETRKMLKSARASIPEATRMGYANSITEQVLRLDEIRDARLIFVYISYVSEVHVSITPGLGFTLTGHRMGFGRGYYDKWFVQNKVKHKIALAFEAQLVDEIPVEDNDVLMDKIVTEKRVIVV